MKPRQITIHSLVATTAAIALLPVCSAHAQAVPPAAPPAAQGTGNEVIVTAQRRSERLKDVPLSVSVATAQTLKNADVTNTADLAMVTPGLRYNGGGVYIQPTIRGITTYQTDAAVDANIATYIDGVYQQETQAAYYNLPDVQEVEVLKGPQGTLFGRNATGGAILINTLSPNLNHVVGQVTAGYGNYNSYYAKGFISIPIVQDRLAASLTVDSEHTDGYLRNLINGRTYSPVDDLLIRGKIRFVPWEGADFTLTGIYTHLIDYQSLKNTNYLGNSDEAIKFPGTIIASQPYTYTSLYNVNMKPITEGISLRGNIKIGPGTFTTTTGLVYSNQSDLLDNGTNSTAPGGKVFFTDLGSYTLSQEFLYAAKFGRFQGTVGTFFYWNKAYERPINFADFVYIWTLDTDFSYGVFADGTYDITDKLSLTGGLRFSSESREAYNTTTCTFALFCSKVNFPPTQLGSENPAFLGKKSWDSVTPRVSLLYKLTDQTNLYFTFSEGFKSGVFNTVSAQAAPVAPETINAFELGAKNNFGNFTFNAAAFYYDYKGLQIPAIFQTCDPVTHNCSFFQVLKNAATARIYGVEVNGIWQATEDLNFEFGATYLNAHYTKFPGAAVDVPVGGVPGMGNVVESKDVSGNTMTESPPFTANLTAHYTKNTSVGRFDVTGTLYYSDKVFFDVGDRITQPAYVTLNAALAWQPAGTHLELRVWGRNLTNATLLQSEVISTDSDGVVFGPPRTFGVEATYKF